MKWHKLKYLQISAKQYQHSYFNVLFRYHWSFLYFWLGRSWINIHSVLGADTRTWEGSVFGRQKYLRGLGFLGLCFAQRELGAVQLVCWILCSMFVGARHVNTHLKIEPLIQHLRRQYNRYWMSGSVSQHRRCQLGSMQMSKVLLTSKNKSVEQIYGMFRRDARSLPSLLSSVEAVGHSQSAW